MYDARIFLFLSTFGFSYINTVLNLSCDLIWILNIILNQVNAFFNNITQVCRWLCLLYVTLQFKATDFDNKLIKLRLHKASSLTMSFSNFSSCSSSITQTAYAKCRSSYAQWSVTTLFNYYSEFNDINKDYLRVSSLIFHCQVRECVCVCVFI